MLNLYRPQSGGLVKDVVPGGPAADALWVDLVEPTPEERDEVGRLIGAELPTRAEMEEIEVSSRLFRRGELTIMTALLLAHSESDKPLADAVTFVLTKDRLITIRYVELQAFRLFTARLERGSMPLDGAEAILDAIVDRLADVLERVGRNIEAVSERIFDPNPKARLDTDEYQAVLGELGRRNDLTGKLRESLLSMARLLSFLTQTLEARAEKDMRSRVRTLARDIQSLQDHSSYLLGKLNYLLEATLGLINIDQNNIIKIMSVAAMVFLPPTLIASIMNFKYLPALPEPWGYPISLVAMLISAVVPYFWFKRRGWL